MGGQVVDPPAVLCECGQRGIARFELRQQLRRTGLTSHHAARAEATDLEGNIGGRAVSDPELSR